MADGFLHEQVDNAIADNEVIAGVIAGVAIDLSLLGFVVAGIACRFMGPDSDLHQVTHAQEARAYKINWLLGFLWELYWIPYAVLNRHRGRSHTWLGTVDRFVYLYWLPIFSSLEIAAHYPQWGSTLAVFWICVLVGHAIPDRAHVRMDGMRYFS